MLKNITIISALALIGLANASMYTYNNGGIVSEKAVSNKDFISLQQSNDHLRRRHVHTRNRFVKRATVADGTIMPTLHKIAQDSSIKIDRVLLAIFTRLCQGCRQAKSSSITIAKQQVTSASQIFQDSMGASAGSFDAYTPVNQFLQSAEVKNLSDKEQAIAVSALVPLVLANINGTGIEGTLYEILAYSSFQERNADALNFTRGIYHSVSPGMVNFATGIDISEVLSGVVASVSIMSGEVGTPATVVNLVEELNLQLQDYY